MAVVYFWKINALVCYPEVAGKEDVVFNIAWERVGENGQIGPVSVAGETAITFDPDAPFTPYADLTKSQVIGWIESVLGQETLAELDAEVDQKLERAAAPSVVAPQLPWA
jgi:hypothetical protein